MANNRAGTLVFSQDIVCVKYGKSFFT